MNYRGIIIKESLIDPDILSLVEKLSEQIEGEGTPEVVHMYKVKVLEDDIELFTEKLSQKLDPKEPWYCHFYSEDSNDSTMYVVFYDRIFFVEKDDPHEALEYGLSLGIPIEQLDFKPQAIQDEQW
jgi:hypothetical protein